MTTTDDLRVDDLLDVEGSTDVSMLCSALLEPRGTDPDSTVAGARGVAEPECRSTRGAMHDYLNRRLPDLRRQRLEAHLDGCAGCIRAFIDIREDAWTRRANAGSTTLTVTRGAAADRFQSGTR